MQEKGAEMGSREFGLEKIIEIIGDEAGKRYHWFIVDVDSSGDLGEALWSDIDSSLEKYGYYEIEWDLLKKITPKMRGVISFFVCGCRNREEFIEKGNEIRKNDGDWTKYSFDLDLEICDSQIWEISGRDTVLVGRLNKVFAPFSATQLL